MRGKVEFPEAPVDACPRGLARVAVPPSFGAERPYHLGLVELRPVLESDTSEKVVAVKFEHRQSAVAPFGPLTLVIAQPLEGLLTIRRADEAADVGVGMEREQLIDIADRHRTEAQPVGLNQHGEQSDRSRLRRSASGPHVARGGKEVSSRERRPGHGLCVA